MIFNVPVTNKEEREEPVKEMESWKVNQKLSYPRIYDIKPKGKKIEISFADGDAVKIAKMVRQKGFDIS